MENEFKFETEGLKHVEIDGKPFVEGYISSSTIDGANSFMTNTSLKSMVNQINDGNIKLDYEHETVLGHDSVLPVGSITNATLDTHGVKIKAEMNKNSGKFNNLWNSIKDGHVNSFSVYFKPLSVIPIATERGNVNMIDDVDLLNVTFTGTPVNKDAVITDYGIRSVMANVIKSYEDGKKLEGTHENEVVKKDADVVNDIHNVKISPTPKSMEITFEEMKKSYNNILEDNQRYKIELDKINGIIDNVNIIKNQMAEQNKKLEDLRNEPMMKSFINTDSINNINNESNDEENNEKKFSAFDLLSR